MFCNKIKYIPNNSHKAMCATQWRTMDPQHAFISIFRLIFAVFFPKDAWNILLHVVLRHFIISVMMKLSFNYSICMQSPVVYGGHWGLMYATWYTFTKNSSEKSIYRLARASRWWTVFRTARFQTQMLYCCAFIIYLFKCIRYTFSLWLYACTAHVPFSWLFVLNYFSVENRNK